MQLNMQLSIEDIQVKIIFSCLGGELHGFPRSDRSTRSPLCTRTCGLQSLRLLSFGTNVVSIHLLHTTLREYLFIQKETLAASKNN